MVTYANLEGSGMKYLYQYFDLLTYRNGYPYGHENMLMLWGSYNTSTYIGILMPCNSAPSVSVPDRTHTPSLHTGKNRSSNFRHLVPDLEFVPWGFVSSKLLKKLTKIFARIGKSGNGESLYLPAVEADYTMAKPLKLTEYVEGRGKHITSKRRHMFNLLSSLRWFLELTLSV